MCLTYVILLNGEGNSTPLQYSCLGNPMDRGAWQATGSPWGCKQWDMTERLNNNHSAESDHQALGSHLECAAQIPCMHSSQYGFHSYENLMPLPI